MYKIIYQKENGEVIERIRNTLPNYSIGEYTSMGWLIIDIKYAYKDDYYSSAEYHKLMSTHKNKRKIKIQIFDILKRYNTSITVLLMLYNIYKIIS